MNPNIASPFIIALLALPPASFTQVAAPQQPETLATSQFQTMDRHKSNLVRIDPQAAWSAYKLVQVEPALYEPESPKHHLSSRDAQKICATVDASLSQSLRDRATAEGPALLIKPVVTEVRRSNALANIATFVAWQITVSYGAASIRFELIDAATGKLVGEISSQRSARPWNVYPWNFYQGFTALGHSSAILRSDARRLHKDLDRIARQVIPPSAPVSGAE